MAKSSPPPSNERNMDTEERLKILEDELKETSRELKEILLDIRTYMMEALSPIPHDLERETASEEPEADRR